MKAGRLRHRLTIDEPVESRAPTGAEVISWVEQIRVFASIEPLTGNEQLRAAQISDSMDTRIKIRWSPEVDRITAKWRLRHEHLGRETVYNIVSVSHALLGRREIEIMARSGLNDG